MLTRTSFGPLGRFVLLALTLVGATGCGFFQVSEQTVSCDLLTQSQCAPDEACVAPNNPQCAAAGSKTVGESCVTLNDCDRAGICVGTDNERFCRKRCDLSAPDCGTGETCVTGTNGANPSGFGVCVPLACDPVSQTGCKEGLRCIPGPVPQCSGVIGVAAENSSCASSESCKTGLVCAQTGKDADGKAKSVCIAVCDATASPTTCPADYVCQPLLDGNGFSLPANQGTCVLEHCNALTDLGCEDSQKCYAATKPVCGFPGNNTLGQACEKVIDCGIGLVCFQTADGQRLCRAKCDTTGTNTDFACPSGESCFAIKDSTGNELPNHIGYCRLP